MKSTDAIFTADPEGFREQNANRPAPQVFKELIQNVFDENATRLEVKIRFDSNAPTGVEFVIEDNVIGGIRDERLIWTIWLSDKTDSPTKRGRMGRGLKELISVADHTLIVTSGPCPAIEFDRHRRGKWTRSNPRKNKPAVGSLISGRAKLWKKGDLDEILTYLHRMRPPEGLTFVVNGVAIKRKHEVETYKLKLPTVLFETDESGDRLERNPSRETRVDLFREEQPWVYEMGIPIEPIDYPLSIDIGQRVPLREKRDTLIEKYRRELFAKVLDARMPFIPDLQMKDNHVLIAAQAPQYLSVETKTKIASAWTEDRPYAANPSEVRAATGMHISVVPLRALPEQIREMVKEVGAPVKDVIESLQFVSCATISKLSPEQKKFVETWEWIALEIGRPCHVRLAEGKPSAIASFNRDGGVLTVYVERFGDVNIREPLGAFPLSVLIHELSHWNPRDQEHGFDFHSDAETVGGQIAAFLVQNKRGA